MTRLVEFEARAAWPTWRALAAFWHAKASMVFTAA